MIPCLCFFTNGSDVHCSCPVLHEPRLCKRCSGRWVAAPSIRCALLAYRWPRPQQLLAASAAGGARRRCSRLRCCSSPAPSNRGSANGAPEGGAFLVDIPEDWEPRAKQQPTGLIAYGTSCRRPVLVLHRPRKKSQVKRLGIFVVDGTGLEPVTSCTSSRCSTS